MENSATEVAEKRLRSMPRDWPEKRAEVILAKLAKADDHRAQVDVVARYLLWAYMKGRGTR